MKKESLIKRAENREEKERGSGMGALGYPRKTPEIAKYALKMAVEIIDEETQHKAIL